MEQTGMAVGNKSEQNRKNPEAVLNAFKLAFPSSDFTGDDVKLIMASTPPYLILQCDLTCLF